MMTMKLLFSISSEMERILFRNVSYVSITPLTPWFMLIFVTVRKKGSLTFETIGFTLVISKADSLLINFSRPSHNKVMHNPLRQR
jgi:hypothetical protein